MSELRADTITASDGTSPVTLTKQSAAKALVNIDGTGTIAFRDSFNATSLTDNGTGDYSYSFSNVFSNTNHTSGGVINSAFTTQNSRVLALEGTLSASGNRVQCAVSTTAGAQDCESVQVITHGDLA